MTIVNGYPAISYWDATNDDLKYVRAYDTNGTIWLGALAIPTLSEWGMIIMSVLLVLTAIIHIQRQDNMKKC